MRGMRIAFLVAALGLVGAAGEAHYGVHRGWAGRPEYGNSLLVRQPLAAADVARIDLGRNRAAHRAVVALPGGTTVIIAMAAMFLIGTKVFNSLAAATISVVACAVAGSVTVLPGVLRLLGDRIDRGRIPLLPHLRTDQTHSRFWTAVIDRVLKRPVLSCAVSAGLLVALALPAVGLKIAKPGDNTLSPQNIPELRALANIRRDFPGASENAKIVATVPPGHAAALRTQGRRLRQLGDKWPCGTSRYRRSEHRCQQGSGLSK